MTELSRKADSAAIKSHIEALKNETWLGPAQIWWPDYLFRFDHVTAAASILNDGHLLSRAAAQAAEKIIFDSAGQGIIKYTSDRWKHYVRLYFRPRTPTQYSSEGIRRREPVDEYSHGGCCPVPVVMLFSSREIMTLEDTLFSDGNLASPRSDCGGDSKFLQRIPFQDVYHDDPIAPQATGRVVHCRNAEVIHPHKLDLFALRKVHCRSSAERETLLSLLMPEAKARWTNSISCGSRPTVHFRFWTFLEDAELLERSARFQFNPSTRTPGPYNLEIIIDREGDRQTWVGESFQARGSVEITDIEGKGQYEIEVKLDGSLIYKSRYESLPDVF